MTADVAQACQDLAAWLPAVRALTAQPDTDGATQHCQPASRPPWNQAAANAWTDVHAGVRELEADLRYAVTGTFITRGGSDQNTLAAIGAISRLAEAVDEDGAGLAAGQVNHWVTVILQLPAVDLEERARIVPAPCPRCDRARLLTYERSGRVGCPACKRRGWMVPGTVSAGCVQWEDGEIT